MVKNGTGGVAEVIAEKVRTTVNVIVTYPAAKKPFEADIQRTDTVGALKTAVLAAFGLSEGQSADGKTWGPTVSFGRRRCFRVLRSGSR